MKKHFTFIGKILSFLMGAAVVMLFWLADGFVKVNREIDLCADTSSGSYIWHEPSRKVVCEGAPSPTSGSK